MNINPVLIKKMRQFQVIESVHLISQEMGTSVFLVGGAVRDILMGTLPEKDFDFVAPYDPAPIARRFAHAVSGSFIEMNDQPPNYRVVFYKERKRIEVDFSCFRGSNIYEDLALRDFTVNALALSVRDLCEADNPTLYDPTGGQADLHSRTLRVTSARSFRDDPLRILRAVRIAKAWNLCVEKQTQEEILDKRESLRSVAVERIRNEFFKSLGYPGASSTIKSLDALGLLVLVLFDPSPSRVKEQREIHCLFPAGATLRACSQSEWALNHLGLFCPEYQPDLEGYFSEEIEAEMHRGSLFKLGGIIQDLSHVSDTSQGLPFPSTDTPARKASAAADRIIKRLGFGRKASAILRNMVQHSDRADLLLHLNHVTERSCFRFFYDLGSHGIESLLHYWAVMRSYGKAGEPLNFDSKLRNLAHRLLYYYYGEFCAARPQPLLSGEHLISLLGLKQGKLIGTLLAKVGEAESQGRLSSREEALAFVRGLLERSE